MSDPRVEKLAMLLVEYCVSVRPGERVMIYASTLATPLVTATYRKVIEAGGNPLVMLQDEAFQEILLRQGSDEQLQHVADPLKLIVETYDCRIAIHGSSNTRSLNSIDPKRMQIRQAAHKELMAISMKRSALGELRWVGTLFPTQAHAQEADMSLSEYEDFVYSACHADKDDPVAEWQKMSSRQQILVDWLSGKHHLRVKGTNIDMTMSIDDRTFINSDGRRNMPSGEIFTGPVESSVQGWVRFTYPAIYGGREVDGVELRFEDGRVVDASAQKNEEFMLSALDTDDGARYLGEFAIGTNDGIDRFTKSILYDEKIGGTVHMALGMGYPETGSKNQSSIHWDMICDMRDGGQIWIDDELFYEGGRFLVLEG
ncbi:MAG: aminopeptidase [Candidatus Promineifilaceae bacterium]